MARRGGQEGIDLHLISHRSSPPPPPAHIGWHTPRSFFHLGQISSAPAPNYNSNTRSNKQDVGYYPLGAWTWVNIMPLFLSEAVEIASARIFLMNWKSISMDIAEVEQSLSEWFITPFGTLLWNNALESEEWLIPMDHGGNFVHRVLRKYGVIYRRLGEIKK
jgi:hypothetical protein